MHDRPGHVDCARDRTGASAGSFATMRPECGQSRGDGPAASEKGVGAMWPVRMRWAVERWAGSLWLIDRTIDSRCACWAEQREMLADRHARHAGRDGAKRPANGVGSVGLGVPGVELARPAPQKDQDARLRPAKPASRRILAQRSRPQKARQTQACQRQRTGPQRRTPRDLKLAEVKTARRIPAIRASHHRLLPAARCFPGNLAPNVQPLANF